VGLFERFGGPPPPQPPLLRGEPEVEQKRGELSIAIAVGPEGGWTDGEVERAIEFGFEPVALGSRILRAVTAPIVALSLVGAAFEKRPSPKKIT
jgi:16S rRNA (uracil1498-N3)-methyltransferase